MQINMYDVFSQDIVEKNITKTLLIQDVQYGDQKIKIDHGVTLELRLEKLSEDEFLLDGTLKTILNLQCDRCSDDVKYPLEVNFSKGIALNLDEEDQEEFINGHYLDLKEFVLNEIYLNFPLKILCKEDCKGICKQCGTNWNYGTCNCKNDDIDPRLMGLKAIFDENFKEV